MNSLCEMGRKFLRGRRARRVYTLVFCVVCGTSCGYDRFDGPTRPAGDSTRPNLLISELSEFYRETPVTLTEEIVLAGYVTTTDRAGNFFRTLLIDDGSGALELKLGLYDLSATYPLGQRLVVHARGLTLGSDHGILQLGLEALPSSGYETDYLGHRVLVDRHVSRDTVIREVTPLRATLAELVSVTPGRLVRVEGLRYDADTTICWAGERSPVTGNPLTVYRQFRDDEGDTVLVVTSGYATFASDTIPAGRISVTGILMRGHIGSRDRMMIKPRDLYDVEDN